MTWFDFWVVQLWGSGILALIGTAIVYSIILIFGRVSYFLMVSVIALYFVVFGIGFYGTGVFILITIFSLVYFFNNLAKWLMGS